MISVDKYETNLRNIITNKKQHHNLADRKEILYQYLNKWKGFPSIEKRIRITSGKIHQGNLGSGNGLMQDDTIKVFTNDKN